MPPEDPQVLRAKYHDWCSARVADRFLALTPEQIYSIAHGRARGDASDDPALADTSRSEVVEDGSPVGELSYPELVERVTSKLSRELGLPAFDEWVAEYRGDPKRYDAELIGFWRSDIVE